MWINIFCPIPKSVATAMCSAKIISITFFEPGQPINQSINTYVNQEDMYPSLSNQVCLLYSFLETLETYLYAYKQKPWIEYMVELIVIILFEYSHWGSLQMDGALFWMHLSQPILLWPCWDKTTKFRTKHPFYLSYSSLREQREPVNSGDSEPANGWMPQGFWSSLIPTFV